MLVNERLTGPESEKETIHIELALEEGMTYTPGDAVGIVPTNRDAAVESVLQALGYTGAERVLDHYKVEISLEEALRSRLGIGKLARGSGEPVCETVRRCAAGWHQGFAGNGEQGCGGRVRVGPRVYRSW